MGILRTFQSQEKDVLLTLWKSIVIPHLDYSSPLWSPVKTSLIQKIELTQKSFIRKIRGMKNLNYWEQLKFLGLYSLERRRERFQILYTWAILENQLPNFHHKHDTYLEGGISQYQHIRHGRKYAIPVFNRGPYFKLASNSLRFRGPRLFLTVYQKNYKI